MEKAEMNVRFTQLKTDSMEREVNLNNEIQRAKNDLRVKDELLKNETEKSRRELSEAVTSVKVDNSVYI
jgi:hypothetical protein